MKREAVIKKLFENQDLGYKEFHLKTCPGAGSVIGVRMPIQRHIAKEIMREDYHEFLDAVQNEYYEETLIEALVIAQAKMSLAERLELLEKFVPKIQNWAVCDALCSSLKFKPDELEQVWNFIMKYQHSPAEFERRFMIVMMMQHFLQLEYLPTIFEILSREQTEQYYVNMAAAWLIAEACIDFREPVLELLQQGRLSDFIQNKAIQKARESYRISNDDKELLATLRRKVRK